MDIQAEVFVDGIEDETSTDPNDRLLDARQTTLFRGRPSVCVEGMQPQDELTESSRHGGDQAYRQVLDRMSEGGYEVRVAGRA